MADGHASGPTPTLIDRDERSRAASTWAPTYQPDLDDVVDEVEERIGRGSSSRWAITWGDPANHRQRRGRRPAVALAIAAGVAMSAICGMVEHAAAPAGVCCADGRCPGVVGRCDRWSGLHRRRISPGSLVGFLTVFGIAARNGIMMISHYRAAGATRGRESFGPSLATRGAPKNA